MKYLLLIITCCLLNQSFGQEKDVHIHGTITEMNSNIPIPDVSIVLLQNQDTIYNLFSDSLGKYSIETLLFPENNYSLSFYASELNQSDISFHVAKDSLKIDEYIFDLSFTIRSVFRCDYFTFYEFNELRNDDSSFVECFKTIMEKYPDYCFKFHQVVNPKEKQHITTKRMEHFKTSLQEAQCDLSRIDFVYNLSNLDNESFERDSRSRIMGQITSSEGKCND